MSSYNVLQEVIVLLIAAVILVAVARRFHLPPVLAYLVTGAAGGPYGFGWIADTADTRFLAEFGVVFLLFTVGLEFSLPQLVAMKREVLGLGGLQVILTTAFVGLIAWYLGASPEAAFVIGGAIAMSSTAIVVKQLSEQLELQSRHGRLSVGILLFQDLAVVPFLIIIPALTGESDSNLFLSMSWALVMGVGATFAMVTIGKWVLRPFFREIASFQSAELFTLTVLLFSLAAAWVTDLVGLSLALGAFLAGMMLGETEFRHQVEADIRPFRDVLLGLFFVTIGMLFDFRVVIDQWPAVLMLVITLTVFKAASITALAMAFRVEEAVALRTGLTLAQAGEFGFALLALAMSGKVIDPYFSQIVLAGLIFSMSASPFLIRNNGVISRLIFTSNYHANRKKIRDVISSGSENLRDHVIICGFGRIGQNIARFLDQEHLAYVALDLDTARIREAQEAGNRVFFGDATHRAIIEAAGITRARILVVSVDNPHAALKIVPYVRQIRPDLPILVRTRDDAHLDELQAAGATEVVPETLEASLMLVTHLLFLLGVDRAQINRHIQNARTHRYQMLREFFPGQAESGGGIDNVRERLHAVTLPDGAFANGKSPAELKLEENDVVLTAVRRGQEGSSRPVPDLLLKPGDVVVMYGAPDALERAEKRILSG